MEHGERHAHAGLLAGRGDQAVGLIRNQPSVIPSQYPLTA